MPISQVVWLVTFVSDEFVRPGGLMPHPPMAGLYIATALRKAGCDPRVIHIVPAQLNDLVAAMKAERPSWIGFSVLTGSTLIPVLEASRRAKKLGIPVVWGGVHASMMPELSLKEAADYVIIGEGEETARIFAANLSDTGLNDSAIPGLMAANSHGTPAPGEPVANLDDFPPAWDLIDISRYRDPSRGGTMPFMFSRGCPYRCRFCYNETIRAARWRRHSDEYLSETITTLKKRATINVLNLQDDFLFEAPGKNSSWIDVLSRHGLKWAASFRAKAITDEFARWIEDHGCIDVRIGMESGHPDTLKALDKRITVEDQYRAAEALAKTSIMGSVGFVINWPGESRESIVATMRVIDDLARINPRLRFNLGYYIPMPRTEVYEEALKDGFAEPDTTEEWGRIFQHPYRFRGFTHRQIEAMELISGRLYRHYLEPWPGQWAVEPMMRWRWRHARFGWFAVGAARRTLKKIYPKLSAVPAKVPDKN